MRRETLRIFLRLGWASYSTWIKDRDAHARCVLSHQPVYRPQASDLKCGVGLNVFFGSNIKLLPDPHIKVIENVPRMPIVRFDEVLHWDVCRDTTEIERQSRHRNDGVIKASLIDEAKNELGIFAHIAAHSQLFAAL